MATMTIQAIPTEYHGVKFRSRLEARWAVFFDSLGVPWQYEPEAFTWPAGLPMDSWRNDLTLGGNYCPDFWLPSISTWFEVKGTCREDEHRIHAEFAYVSGQRHITAIGDVSIEVQVGGGESSMWLNGGCDYDYAWCVCSGCGKPGIEYSGREERICGHPDGPHKNYTTNDPRIITAYSAARSARFWK